MPIFKVQNSWCYFASKTCSIAITSVIVAVTLSGVPLFQKSDDSGSADMGKENFVFPLLDDTLNGKSRSDTTDSYAIAIKPCSVHETYRNRDEMGPPYRPAQQEVVPSLHEFTCRWAVGNEVSIDSMRLPMYVRAVGDSLRMGDALAYSVKMAAPEHLDYTDLFFVAEVGDSLFYADIERAFEGGNPESLTVRSICPIDVDSTSTQYIWYEYAEITRGEKDSTSVYERWIGRILAYDDRRGMRSLHKAPVRAEARKGGKVLGVTHWDVSMPEPGMMKIEKRLKKGGDVSLAPPDWLGRYVIDESATSKREVEAEAGYKLIIDTTEVENWREKYERY